MTLHLKSDLDIIVHRRLFANIVSTDLFGLVSDEVLAAYLTSVL